MKKIFLLTGLILFTTLAFANPPWMGGGPAQMGGSPAGGSGAIVNPQISGTITDQPQTGPSVLSQLQSIRQSIVDLRGLIEIQGHQIEQLQAKQQMLESLLAQKVGGSTQQTPTPQPTSKVKNNDNQQTTTQRNEAQSDYQYAFQLIQNKQYSQAINALQTYIKKYPTDQNIANAEYWLGELYAISGNGKKAIAQFNNVVNNFPNSTKAPDAMLKLGVIAYGNNQYKQAKAWFAKIVNQYPNSAAARVAGEQLSQLQQAGY